MSDTNTNLPAAVADQQPCKECGGGNGRHYTDCTVWIGDLISARRLRDEFAMAALTGMSAVFNDRDPDQVSQWCYGYADAMLSARNAAKESA